MRHKTFLLLIILTLAGPLSAEPAPLWNWYYVEPRFDTSNKLPVVAVLRQGHATATLVGDSIKIEMWELFDEESAQLQNGANKIVFEGRGYANPQFNGLLRGLNLDDDRSELWVGQYREMRPSHSPNKTSATCVFKEILLRGSGVGRVVTPKSKSPTLVNGGVLMLFLQQPEVCMSVW